MKNIATRLLVLLAVSVALVGCNDSEEDTTIVEEAPVYSMGTNGHPAIVVADNDGLVVVDLTTGEVVPYDIFIKNNGSNGIVSIKVSPYIPPPPPEDPEAP